MLRRIALLAVAVTLTAASVAEGYRIVGVRWPTRTITYTSNLKAYTGAVTKAVRTWNAAHVGVRLKPSRLSRAQLTFGYAQRGCGGLTQVGWDPFTDGAVVYVGRGCSSSPARVTTIAHELGHVLGLGHDDRRCALMNSVGEARTGVPLHCPRTAAFIRRWHAKPITADDVRGARAAWKRAAPRRHRALVVPRPAVGSLTQGRTPTTFRVTVDTHGATPRWSFGDPRSGARNRASGTAAVHRFSRAGHYRVTVRYGAHRVTVPYTVEK